MQYKIKIFSAIFGLILLIAGILLLVIKSDVRIAYPLTLIGVGGYLFAIGLASLLLSRLYYNDRTEASANRNKFLSRLEIFVYSFIGIVLTVSIILYFTVL